MKFRSFFCSKIIWNGIPRFLTSKNGSERNSEEYSLPRNGSERNSDGFSLPINGSERNSEGVSLPRNGSEQNSEGFSLPRNGSEWNSEVFLFRETGEIPTELPSVPTCSEFRGIFFSRKMAALPHTRIFPHHWPLPHIVSRISTMIILSGYNKKNMLTVILLLVFCGNTTYSPPSRPITI
jgi:hypothetical protein